MPLLTDLSLAMRTDPLALIRGARELVTVLYGPSVTFAFPDVKAEASRVSVFHLNLIPAVDGTALNWCEQHALRELMSENLLFAKISEPEMSVIYFDDHFRDRMGEMNRGNIEVFPKLWNLRPYNKTNGEVTRIPRLTAAYHKLRETKDWGVYKKLPEEVPEFPLIRRMLLGADSVVQTPRLRDFETNERRVAKFSEMMDPCFVGRNAAVLQYTQFAYTVETMGRRMSNTATPKPGQFYEEWLKADLAPMVIRGKADQPEVSLILTSVKPELMVGGKLQTRTMLAPSGCEEVKVNHGRRKISQLAGYLNRNFQMEQRMKSKGPQVQEKTQNETMGRKLDVNRMNLCNRIPIRPRERTIRLRKEGCPAWTSTCSATLKTARTRWKRRLSRRTRELPRWSPRQPSWRRTGTCSRAALRAILRTPR